MTAPFKAPVKGSGVYTALQHLQKLGGQASAADLMAQLVWAASLAKFRQLIIKPLERDRLVLCRDEVVTITGRGASVLAPASEAMPVPPGAYVAPQRPLSAANRPALRVMRPGALDFRAIPSRVGDQVVPHGEKVAA